MSASTQRKVALAVGTPSALVVTAILFLLIADYVRTRREAPINQQRIETLEQQVKDDAGQAAALVDELERQTDASLERQATHTLEARVLILAAVLFLISAKWFLSLAGKPPPSLNTVLAARNRLNNDAVGAKKDSRTSEASLSETVGTEQLDLSIVDAIVEREGRGPEAAIPIIQAVQAHYRYLPDDALRRVCEMTEIPPAQIAGVSTFYSQFRRSPMGKHLVKVCHGTACHVSGARTTTDEIRRYLAIAPDADTDPQRMFTVQEVACVGCCSLAPVIMLDDVTVGSLTPATACEAIEAHLAKSQASRAVPGPVHASNQGRLHRGNGLQIRVGMGSCGIAGGAQRVRDALEEATERTGAAATVKPVGCNGMCHREPLVEIVDGNTTRALYGNVTPELARRIVQRHSRKTSWLPRAGWIEDDLSALAIDPTAGPAHAYLGKQVRIVLENCGQLDPLSITDSLAYDGYQALEACLKRMTPEAVIATIEQSGLRGRGGAGFPTGRKWTFVRGQPGLEKYVICNGDEGDPGAFMDRLVLEADPHRVLEGLAIAAYAVGASAGYLYIRAEYPQAVRHVRHALEQATERGFLGDRIFGTDFSLHLELREGAGAFVCGEETALIASLEGQRGMPRLRPPFPAERGFRDKPTSVNNVETLACVPWILRHGHEAFTAFGTESSKGTKVFALAGKINRGGLIEVPMGITIREIVEEIGGGIKDGRTFKAVQMGGPSGGCIPAHLADTRIDYDELTRTGAIMGSGGMVVLDDLDCMVDLARFFLRFTQSESCGKCTFCRIGTKRMLEILDRLCEGQGQPDDLDTLEELANRVKRTSLCGLGQTAPNPVLTTLKYFRQEYEAHLHEGRCPAGRCPTLIHYRVTDACTGCTLCAQVCPVEAIAYQPYEKHEIDDGVCTRCGMCMVACKDDAILVV